MPKRTPREDLERAFHVSFKLPAQAAALLDAYRDQVAAEARREAMLHAAGLAAEGIGSHGGEATQHVIVARLRIAALTNDPCAQCTHRRGDHLDHGGFCTLRTSGTRVCGCRQYAHPAQAARTTQEGQPAPQTVWVRQEGEMPGGHLYPTLDLAQRRTVADYAEALDLDEDQAAALRWETHGNLVELWSGDEDTGWFLTTQTIEED